MPTSSNYGTGRRKTATARVFLRKGSGNIRVNERTLDEFFGRKTARMDRPAAAGSRQPRQELRRRSHGEGRWHHRPNGAIRHGLTRALIEYDETLRKTLRDAGYVTRDAREVERKKVGFRKARRGTQFSKR